MGAVTTATVTTWINLIDTMFSKRTENKLTRATHKIDGYC